MRSVFALPENETPRDYIDYDFPDEINNGPLAYRTTAAVVVVDGALLFKCLSEATDADSALVTLAYLL